MTTNFDENQNINYMKVKTLTALAISLPVMFFSCSGGGDNSNSTKSDDGAKTESSYDETQGIGDYTHENVELGELNPELASKGKAITDSKCASCHKMTDERLVGPGWKGITSKHKPAWILNFISNPDPMIDQDPELQAQLEECMVRMPNQNLSKDDAFAVLEFMRQNDGQ